MRTNSLILCLIVSIASFYAAPVKKKSKTNMFLPGWYVGANMGYNIYLAEGNAFFDSKVLSDFSIVHNGGFIQRVELGYNYTPVIALRGFVTVINQNWPDPRQVLANGSSKVVSFGSESLTADLMINISNWWGAYEPNKAFTLTAFGGFGLVHRDKASFNSDWFTVSLRGGLQSNFRLARQLDLNLILDGSIVGDRFNDHVVTFPYEFYGSFSAGLTYHLRERSKRTPPPVVPIIEKMPGLKRVLPDGTVIIDTVTVNPTDVQSDIEVMPLQLKVDTTATTKKLSKVSVPKVVKEETFTNPFVKVESSVENILPSEKATKFRQSIFYPFKESVVEKEKQKAALVKVNEYLNAYPQAKILLTSYDSKTVVTAAGQKKSVVSRAEEVQAVLVNVYGISRSRIIVKSLSSKSMPTKNDDGDRVVVVTSLASN